MTIQNAADLQWPETELANADSVDSAASVTASIICGVAL